MDIPSTIIAAQERLTEMVLSIPGVVGTAIGERYGEPCIKVMIVRLSDDLIQKIPAQYEGHRVVLQETGVIRKRDAP